MLRIVIFAAFLASLLHAAELPALTIQHLAALSDERGISEFAKGTEPLRDRFCIEDTARALAAVLRMHELAPSDDKQDLAWRYLKAIAALQQADGGFSFGFRKNEGLMERQTEGDNFTRVLWGLGHACAHGVDAAMKKSAGEMFEKALPKFHPDARQHMAQSYAIQGLHEFLQARPEHQAARAALLGACDSVLQRLQDPAWQWPEKVVTYDSARLPLALLLAYDSTREERFRSAGLRVLEFLAAVNFPGDGATLRIIGNKGWYRQGSEPSAFDQQPVDASSLVEACMAAWALKHDPKWRGRAETAFAWFMGANARQVPLFDAESGGCHDALGASGVNRNEGAEATLSFWIARAEIELLRRASP